MPRSSGLSRGRRISQRRRKGWDVGPGQAGPQSQISATTAVIASSAGAFGQDGLTVMRLRGEAMFFLSAATAVNDGFRGAFGIGIATTAAVVAGAASVPTPIGEQAWDGWMFWQPLRLIAAAPIDGSVSTDADGMNSVTASIRFEVDTKAMRKVAIDESIYAAIDVTEVGTAVMNWFFDSRVLVALP